MQEFIEFLKHYSPIISVLTFIIGLYIGNKQAIGRDKRKEFNDHSEPIIDYFEYMIKWYKNGLITYTCPLPTDSINKLTRRMNPIERNRFNQLLIKYQTLYNKLLRKNDTDKMTPIYSDIIKITEKIIKLLQLK